MPFVYLRWGFSYFNEHIDIDNVNYNEIWIKYFLC
ncbi:hypothetical protein Sesv_3665 [Salmonella enterica subsp. enterica serovar Virchow str. SVQ1]|nr:hypothetical protein Sesv_3665 [Salmonella enterica subsp. enterica serovar Virchow str. SVQ1]